MKGNPAAAAADKARKQAVLEKRAIQRAAAIGQARCSKAISRPPTAYEIADTSEWCADPQISEPERVRRLFRVDVFADQLPGDFVLPAQRLLNESPDVDAAAAKVIAVGRALVRLELITGPAADLIGQLATRLDMAAAERMPDSERSRRRTIDALHTGLLISLRRLATSWLRGLPRCSTKMRLRAALLVRTLQSRLAALRASATTGMGVLRPPIHVVAGCPGLPRGPTAALVARRAASEGSARINARQVYATA